MILTQSLRGTIIDHFQGLEFWTEHWGRAAIIVVGSSARGIEDQFTDIDTIALVEDGAWHPIYEYYRHGFEAGSVRVLNPAAFRYDEFPLTLIDDVPGHYKVQTFEDLECAVKGFDDIQRWVHASSAVLHDPTGRYARIRSLCSTYPDDVWHAKLRRHYLAAWQASGGAKNSLRREEREAVALAMTRCVSHLLKLCCVMDRKPFPYDKWLYQESMATSAGVALRVYFEDFFQELGQPEIRRARPGTYERPNDRDADLEEFPIFAVWRHAKKYFDQVLPILKQPGGDPDGQDPSRSGISGE